MQKKNLIEERNEPITNVTQTACFDSACVMVLRSALKAVVISSLC